MKRDNLYYHDKLSLWEIVTFVSVFIGIVAFLLLGLALNGYVFMLFWNWLVPMVWLQAPVLTFWGGTGCVFLILASLFAFRWWQINR